MYILDFIRIGRQCWNVDIPYVISPRGCLVQRAIWSGRWFRKWLGLFFVFAPWIRRAAALHFLTAAEAESSLRFNVPHFVCGNGTELSDIDSTSSPTRRVLFIGRIDLEHKGLDRLVRSTVKSADVFRHGGWVLEIRGPDYKGDLARLEALIERKGVADFVKVGGPVNGWEKEELLKNSALFVHASRFEGQPQAVLEAMAYATPVLVSRGTNMLEVVRSAQAGFCFEDVEENGWNSILRTLSENHFQEQIGKRGRALVQNTADWKQVGAQTVTYYEELIRRKRGAQQSHEVVDT